MQYTLTFVFFIIIALLSISFIWYSIYNIIRGFLEDYDGELSVKDKKEFRLQLAGTILLIPFFLLVLLQVSKLPIDYFNKEVEMNYGEVERIEKKNIFFYKYEKITFTESEKPLYSIHNDFMENIQVDGKYTLFYYPYSRIIIDYNWGEMYKSYNRGNLPF